ncbi:uncharacterized protein [Panulirus ornatus]|uniref:uncharacterized protein n=1 Tax=Panulirus ornatus TaxID=150431 RepID=UPI003A870962
MTKNVSVSKPVKKMLEEVLFVATVTSSWSIASPSQVNAGSLHLPSRYEEVEEAGYFHVRRDFTGNETSDRINRVNNMYKASSSAQTIEKQYGPHNSADEAKVARNVRGGRSRWLDGNRRRRRYRPTSDERRRRGRRPPRNRKKPRRNFDKKTRWPSSDSRRRRKKLPKNRYNRGNRTYGRPPKRTLKTGGKNWNGKRKFNYPNRRPGWSAGQQYRSVDPRRAKVRRHLVMQHNLLRAKVVPRAADMLAVGWYDTAAEQAQAWAEQCDPHTETDHPSVRWTSRYGACGQNVLVSTTKKRWSQVIARWWSGRRYFRYGGDNLNSSAVSAYTQMAWYNSHQLGCGFAQCSTTGGATFFRYVCNYCPAGNDPKRLSQPYTRGRICSMCPGSCRSVCHRRQCHLCTNACAYSDLWINCATLNKEWHEWLCNTKTKQGVERFKNCRATCQCVREIT